MAVGTQAAVKGLTSILKPAMILIVGFMVIANVRADGRVYNAGGSLVGAIGVSGAPGGDADEACVKAGTEAIKDKLDF